MLLNAVAGHMGGLKSTLPMRTDTLVMGFSATKAITATLAHMMVEQGYMTYDEPVCESIWPDFCPTEDAPKDLAKALDLSEEEVKKRWAWKRQITLRHILNHTAGMRKCVPTVMTFKRFASCEECCEGLEYNPEKPNETMLPHLEPGTLCEYHHQTFGWLAGGALMGAYNRKHTDRKHTFVEVYDALMVPFLSKETLTTGFRPYQGVGENSSWAYVDSEVTFNEFIQKQQEASTLGEQEDEEAPEDLGGVNIAEMQEQFSGREFLLDARMWNSEHVKNANHPGAGGRFTATGLAYFYKDLMTKNMMSPERLAMVSSEISKVDSGAR